jgi:hypothetical protein
VIKPKVKYLLLTKTVMHRIEPDNSVVSLYYTQENKMNSSTHKVHADVTIFSEQARFLLFGLVCSGQNPERYFMEVGNQRIIERPIVIISIKTRLLKFLFSNLTVLAYCPSKAHGTLSKNK